MKKIIITLLLIGSSCLSFGQGGLSTFSGRIVNAQTREPIAGAYVSMPTIGYGTAVNHEGEFRFSYPAISVDSQVVISVLGYKNHISTAAEFATGGQNLIELTPMIGSVNTLGISDAREFVKAAIDSIKANAPTEAVYQNGFYCEMVEFNRVGLVKVNEGLLRVERFPGATPPTDKIKYLRGRKLEWRGQTSKMDGFGFENGAAIVTRSLSTGLPDYLQAKELKNYEFSMDSLITTFDDKIVYGVAFEPKNKRVKAARTGHLYIEPETKAIVRIEYEMTAEAAREVMSTGFSNIEVNGKSVSAYTQFRQFNGKWMLQDAVVKFVANFEDKLENRFEVDADITLRFIANVSLPLIRSSIPDDRQLTTTENFPRTWIYSDDIWEGQNYLLPTEKMREITHRVN
ncbi:MAG: carboxypeptidase-like regulatory domain-containing protein [Spirosomaceae bacterium]|nr:carboxypeptidase-like regulatory domain-containing protein [Spirosomataceae bacterium]